MRGRRAEALCGRGSPEARLVSPAPSAPGQGPRSAIGRKVPTTTRLASFATSTRSSAPGGMTTGTTVTPSARWTAMDALASNLLESRSSSVGPTRVSLAVTRAREPRSELNRRPIVVGPDERHQHGAVSRLAGGNDRHVARRCVEQVGDGGVIQAAAADPSTITRSTSCSAANLATSRPGDADLNAATRVAVPAATNRSLCA